jgi:hypothetical protein
VCREGLPSILSLGKPVFSSHFLAKEIVSRSQYCLG